MSSNTEIKEGKEKLDHRKKTVIIAGMGPGGLVAALKAKEKGYEVIIFDNRDHYTRQQRISLEPNIISYLHTLSDQNDPRDKAFLDQIPIKESSAKKGYNVELAALQKYLESKLIKHGIKLCKGQHYEITGFNLNGKTANSIKVKVKDKNKDLDNEKEKAKDKAQHTDKEQSKDQNKEQDKDKKPDKDKEQVTEQTINFDYFIAADGAQRTMAKLLNETLNKQKENKNEKEREKEQEEGIVFQPLEIQTRQVPHGTIALRIKIGQKVDIVPKRDSEISLKDIQKLQALGWENPFPPETYIFKDQHSEKFFLGGEIPQKILDEKNKQEQEKMLLSWGKLMMQIKFGVKDPNKDLELDLNRGNDEVSKKENSLKATAFALKLNYALNPTLQLNHQGYFISIGDAAMNANFLLAKGASHAIHDAFDTVRCLPFPNEEDSFDEGEFNESRNERRQEIIRTMSDNQRKRKEEDLKYLHQVQTAMIDRSLYFLTLAKPLSASDKDFQKVFLDFQTFVNQANTSKFETIGSIDAFYQKNLEFTEHLNNALDKFYEISSRREIEMLEKRLEAARTRFEKIGGSKLNGPEDILSKRSKVLQKEREEASRLGREIEEIRKKINEKEAYVQRIKNKDLKESTPKLLQQETQVLYGYVQKLKDMGSESKKKKDEEMRVRPSTPKLDD